jgi:hypothetical protein
MDWVVKASEPPRMAATTRTEMGRELREIIVLVL